MIAAGAGGPLAGRAALFEEVFDQAPVGMAILATGSDGSPTVVRANAALSSLLGRTDEEIRAAPVPRLFGAEADDGVWLADALACDEPTTVERRIERADHEGLWALITISRIVGDDAAPRTHLLQLQDTSRRRRHEGRLEYLAEHDPLTGLVNRRRFRVELERQIAHVRRYGGPLCVMFMDLDRFKDVNDALGHDGGDDLLRAVAALLRDLSRSTDVVARLGGDEFAVLLPQTVAEDALVHAERIRRAVATAPLGATADPTPMSVSIGISQLGREVTKTSEDLIVEADVAMYAAKDAGRNAVRLYEPGIGGHGRRDPRATSAAIRHALEHERFVLHAQPLLDLARREISHYELLIRLPRDDGSLVAPGDFMPYAERSGLAPDIDRWVVGRALGILAGLPAAPRVAVTVNLCGGSLNDADFLRWLAVALGEHAVPRGRLVFEITEADAITSPGRIGRLAEDLRAHGCELSLDGFGAQFGSLHQVKELPCDYIKIHRGYIRALAHSQTDQVMVQALVDVCQAVGMRTVAEFVGDGETLERIAELGVDYAQGFHVGRPLPLSEIELLRPPAGR